MNNQTVDAIRNFFAQWNGSEGVRALCVAFYEHMASLPSVRLDFVSRPGISHSIRMLAQNGDMTALLDIIDDDPANRWISLCFPDSKVTDPEERGDVVPLGLNGADARCFDIDEASAGMEGYITVRLTEAAA